MKYEVWFIEDPILMAIFRERADAENYIHYLWGTNGLRAEVRLRYIRSYEAMEG